MNACRRPSATRRDSTGLQHGGKKGACQWSRVTAESSNERTVELSRFCEQITAEVSRRDAADPPAFRARRCAVSARCVARVAEHTEQRCSERQTQTQMTLRVNSRARRCRVKQQRRKRQGAAAQAGSQRQSRPRATATRGRGQRRRSSLRSAQPSARSMLGVFGVFGDPRRAARGPSGSFSCRRAFIC